MDLVFLKISWFLGFVVFLLWLIVSFIIVDFLLVFLVEEFICCFNFKLIGCMLIMLMVVGMVFLVWFNWLLLLIWVVFVVNEFLVLIIIIFWVWVFVVVEIGVGGVGLILINCDFEIGKIWDFVCFDFIWNGLVRTFFVWICWIGIRIIGCDWLLIVYRIGFRIVVCLGNVSGWVRIVWWIEDVIIGMFELEIDFVSENIGVFVRVENVFGWIEFIFCVNLGIFGIDKMVVVLGLVVIWDLLFCLNLDCLFFVILELYVLIVIGNDFLDFIVVMEKFWVGFFFWLIMGNNVFFLIFFLIKVIFFLLCSFLIILLIFFDFFKLYFIILLECICLICFFIFFFELYVII